MSDSESSGGSSEEDAPPVVPPFQLPDDEDDDDDEESYDGDTDEHGSGSAHEMAEAETTGGLPDFSESDSSEGQAEASSEDDDETEEADSSGDENDMEGIPLPMAPAEAQHEVESESDEGAGAVLNEPLPAEPGSDGEPVMPQLPAAPEAEEESESDDDEEEEESSDSDGSDKSSREESEEEDPKVAAANAEELRKAAEVEEAKRKLQEEEMKKKVLADIASDSDDEIRHKEKVKDKDEILAKETDDDADQAKEEARLKKWENPQFHRWWKVIMFPFIFVTVIVLVVLAAVLLIYLRPEPSVVATSEADTEFSAARAQEYMMQMNKARAFNGTFVSWLNSTIFDIRNGVTTVRTDSVTASGTLSEYNNIEVLTTYEGFPSLLVKVEGSQPGTILVSVPLDTLPFLKQGTSAAMIAMSLELMNNLIANSRLDHSILFSFVSGTEYGNAGAKESLHHAWMEDVVSFINLGNRGNGGAFGILRATDDSANLITAYSMSYNLISAPCTGNNFVNRVIQSIPISFYTDYDVYETVRPGIEMSFMDGQSEYHTTLDTVDKIEISALQGAGTGLLRLLQNSITPNTGLFLGREFLFFDFFGWFMLVADVTTILIITMVCLIIFLITLLIAYILRWVKPAVEIVRYDVRKLKLLNFVFAFLVIASPVSTAVSISLLVGVVLGVVSPSYFNIYPNIGYLFGISSVAFVNAAFVGIFMQSQAFVRRVNKHTEMQLYTSAIIIMGILTLVDSLFFSFGFAMFTFVWFVFGLLGFTVTVPLTTVLEFFNFTKRFQTRSWDWQWIIRFLIAVPIPMLVTLAPLYSFSKVLAPNLLTMSLYPNWLTTAFPSVILIFIPVILFGIIFMVTITFVAGRGYYSPVVVVAFVLLVVFAFLPAFVPDFGTENPRPLVASHIKQGTIYSYMFISSPIISRYLRLFSDLRGDLKDSSAYACQDLNLAFNELTMGYYCRSNNLNNPNVSDGALTLVSQQYLNQIKTFRLRVPATDTMYRWSCEFAQGYDISSFEVGGVDYPATGENGRTYVYYGTSTHNFAVKINSLTNFFDLDGTTCRFDYYSVSPEYINFVAGNLTDYTTAWASRHSMSPTVVLKDFDLS